MFKGEKMYCDDEHLHPPTTVPSYTLLFLRYDQHKILMVKFTMARSKIKSSIKSPSINLQHLMNSTI